MRWVDTSADESIDVVMREILHHAELFLNRPSHLSHQHPLVHKSSHFYTLNIGKYGSFGFQINVWMVGKIVLMYYSSMIIYSSRTRVLIFRIQTQTWTRTRIGLGLRSTLGLGLETSELRLAL